MSVSIQDTAKINYPRATQYAKTHKTEQDNYKDISFYAELADYVLYHSTSSKILTHNLQILADITEDLRCATTNILVDELKERLKGLQLC